MPNPADESFENLEIYKKIILKMTYFLRCHMVYTEEI